MNEKWKVRDVNFDHIGNALIATFIIASLEGWPDIMF